jgi:DNA mismatch repair protein MutL
MPIRVLPAEVVGKIAAGEVVDRPASVVKELIENSIDAGATDIRLEIRAGGRRLIRVSDDGSGIPAQEVPLAFARHATSKLTSASDLDRIATLGFRGEALASIAAVSQVTVLTRPASQAAGRYLVIDGGEIARQEGRGCPVGTVINVEHLFRNVPARLKFLRQAQTEAGRIFSVVSHYALAYPTIRFSLTSDGRQTVQSTGNGQLYDVLIAIHGLDTVEQMLQICSADESKTAISVSGYIGMPALHRASRNYIALFVNRRWIQDRSLSHAVAQAYHTMLPVGRHPVAAVFLELDPGEVDVNVHPTKREVRFRNARQAFSAVQRAVRHTLVEHAPVPALARDARSWSTSDWVRREALLQPMPGQDVTTQAAMDFYRPAEDDSGFGPVGPVRLPLLRVVGQVGQTYIVAEGPQGMYLIDQHAAHERVLYEQMMSEKGRQAVASQTLLEPVVLDLDPLLAGSLAEHQTLLNQVGFHLEPFGGTATLVRAVPAIVAEPNVQQVVEDILEMLRNNDDPLAAQAEERLIAAVCKRAAIKGGQTLSHDELELLVRKLEQCESPRTCPHGRPTVIHFSVEELEKGFGRR